MFFVLTSSAVSASLTASTAPLVSEAVGAAAAASEAMIFSKDLEASATLTLATLVRALTFSSAKEQYVNLQFGLILAKTSPNRIKQDHCTSSYALQELTNSRLGLKATHDQYLAVCNV